MAVLEVEEVEERVLQCEVDNNNIQRGFGFGSGGGYDIVGDSGDTGGYDIQGDTGGYDIAGDS